MEKPSQTLGLVACYTGAQLGRQSLASRIIRGAQAPYLRNRAPKLTDDKSIATRHPSTLDAEARIVNFIT